MKLPKTSWQLLLSIIPVAKALIFDPEQVGFNLNENKTATNPLDYWGEWIGHGYHPSPENWRMPFYVLFLDRFVNGDPSNDNANGTQFEHDHLSNQLRNGGDVRGLIDSFDYLQGMGIQVQDTGHRGGYTWRTRLTGLRRYTLSACLRSTFLGHTTASHRWT
jgi:alpha-1,3-glucan synthase